nr:glutamate-5-semialdehyde dehydrogenase [Oceanibacterium hippocampi]
MNPAIAASPLRDDDIDALMTGIGRAARTAATALGRAGRAEKDAALHAAARSLRNSVPAIRAANEMDMSAGRARQLTPALLDRLMLDEKRIEAMAKGLEDIAALPDPVGRILAEWTRPNGLRIARKSTPLGVIGIIYESRPNVTADAGALCLKSGNAAILRGGSESYHSSRAIWDCLQAGLEEAGLPREAIQMVPTTDRAAVGKLLAMTDYVDVIVPRGGRSLIERVQADARVPVFAHLEGLVHMYLDRAADPAMATELVVNAKMRRPGICGALETLLVHRDCLTTILPGILEKLLAAGCEIRGDDTVRALDNRVVPATELDWRTEYLDAILSVKAVADLDEATDFIEAHGSHHTESIVTDDQVAADAFLDRVDSAIVMHNASTQFADGGEFGMGAEIGISTGRMHARGPVGLEQLTSFKYVIRGSGQARPS